MPETKRVRVVREIFYEGPAHWVDGTLKRMITEPIVVTRHRDGQIGFIEGRVLEQSELQPTGTVPSRSIYYSQLPDADREDCS